MLPEELLSLRGQHDLARGAALVLSDLEHLQMTVKVAALERCQRARAKRQQCQAAQKGGKIWRSGLDQCASLPLVQVQLTAPVDVLQRPQSLTPSEVEVTTPSSWASSSTARSGA